MKDILTTEEWIRAIKALLFLNKDPDDIDIEQIKKIIEESTAGAYELPAVTETDNGKVLGVENGAWSVVNGGGDAGYECGEAITPLFEETVTTVDYGGGSGADLAYSDPITADKLIVLLNGTEYVCPKINYGSDGDVYYGGFNPSIGQPDYTDYPFYIWSSANNGNGLDTETAGTYMLEVKTQTTTLTTTPCFEKAVKTVVDRGYECNETITPLFEETVTTEVDGAIAGANLYYSELITADKLTVVFNGTQYVCPKIISGGGNMVCYGGIDEDDDFDFTNYPFCISSASGANVIVTESPMTVTVGVSATSLIVETTESFRRAVESVVASISEGGGK